MAAFCTERLTDADEVRARHAAYYTELAERADPGCAAPTSGGGWRCWTPRWRTCARRWCTAVGCGWRSR
ncbi:hypothetical protein NKG94_07190 [Micromonospora sp. M12]